MPSSRKEEMTSEDKIKRTEETQTVAQLIALHQDEADAPITVFWIDAARSQLRTRS
jgi:hypothetical protein